MTLAKSLHKCFAIYLSLHMRQTHLVKKRISGQASQSPLFCRARSNRAASVDRSGFAYSSVSRLTTAPAASFFITKGRVARGRVCPSVNVTDPDSGPMRKI
jgi:hypothetical protein